MSDIRLEIIDQNNEGDVLFVYETRRHPEIVPFLFGKPPENLESHKAWLKANVPDKRLIFILKADGKSVGYCQAYDFIDKDTVEIGFVIHPECQGMGYGNLMVNLLVEELKKLIPKKRMVLEVRADNNRAIMTYERHGFIKTIVHMEKEQEDVLKMNTEIDLLGQKVCMVMGYTPSNPKFAEMGKFVSETNMAYCRRHGYGFRLYTSGFAVDRHPSWSKLLFIQDALKSYSWVMWVDTDAIVTNPEIELEKFMDDNFMLVVGKQNWGILPENSINFGIFLIRNDPFVNEFVDRVWSGTRNTENDGWEQASVKRIIESEPFRSKVKVVCRRDFNSLVPHESLKIPSDFNHNTESWHKGDFIAHYGGQRNDVVEEMKKILEKQ